MRYRLQCHNGRIDTVAGLRTLGAGIGVGALAGTRVGLKNSIARVKISCADSLMAAFGMDVAVSPTDLQFGSALPASHVDLMHQRLSERSVYFMSGRSIR